MYSMSAFLRQIPKAELHLHVEGTLEPELIFKLAERNRIKLKYKTIPECKAAYKFADLQAFLDIYYYAMKVLITEQDFYDLAWAYFQKAAKQNIRHVEMFFDPQAHLQRGVEFRTVINGLKRAVETAKKTFGITGGLIMCFLRDLPEENAESVFQYAIKYKDSILGIGLDSAEVGNPPTKFKNVFAKAREAGFYTTAHAGEEGPAEYIWEALEILKVSRIDHGLKCVQDPKLINYLAQEKIPLTMCPLSNWRLHVVPDLKHYPLKHLLDLGVHVTINSDDPAYFGGYQEKNFAVLQHNLTLSKQDIYQVCKNAFMGSFLPELEKQRYLVELERFMKKTAR